MYTYLIFFLCEIKFLTYRSVARSAKSSMTFRYIVNCGRPNVRLMYQIIKNFYWHVDICICIAAISIKLFELEVYVPKGQVNFFLRIRMH